MDFRILGPIEVADGSRVVPLPRPKQRALLAVLLLNAGKLVSTDRLIDDLWGERAPPRARNALQNSVSQVRKAIGAELILRQPTGYLLAVGPEQIDLGRFELRVATARAATHPRERAAQLHEALALWRGEPFADLPDEPFTVLERPPLLQQRLSADEDLIDAELALGRHADVLDRIEGLIAANPYDERLRGQLMLALFRAGRAADALDAFARAREALLELGLDPGPELQSLQRRILDNDPTLLLPDAPAPVEEARRKTVTVVSVAAGSAAELDPERIGPLSDRVAEETAAAAARHAGTPIRLGDGSAMAVFGIPTAHEDDALRAVRAADELRESLVTLEPRLGVATGEVLVTGTGRSPVVGTPVSAARELEQAAEPGEIRLAPTTMRLLRGSVAAEPAEAGRAPAGRLLELVFGAPAIERHLDAPLVNRTAELETLCSAFEQTRDGSRCRLVTVVGEAGLGKTRLVTELCDRVRDEGVVLIGRCVSYGEGASLLPLRELLEQAGDDLDALLAGAGSVGEEQLRIRDYFASLAAEQPVVLVFEDIHWAEPGLLDLIESLPAQVGQAPILALCLARPELLDARPGWPEPLVLAPLERAETEALVEQIPGPVEPELTARIAELAEGNPLYAEQLLAYVADGGSLETVPPTVEALLTSRLDRLAPGERAVLQRAAVIGRELDEATLTELAEPDAGVAGLERSGLLQRMSRRSLQFHHGLVRDVAYTGLPKAQRRELHERLAGILERDEAAPDELVGYHLEQAFRYASELGTLDGSGRPLALDAGNRLGTAGIRAWKRGDTPAALNLLGRAAELLPEQDPFGLELRCELGVALRAAGELREAENVLAGAAESAVRAGDRRAELRARLELVNVRLLSDPAGRADELRRAAAEAIPVFEAAGDERSLSRAWRLTAYVEGAMSCRYEASAEASERVLEHSKRSGWSTAACLGDLAGALYHGPAPAEAAARRCRELLEDADLGGEANVLPHLAGLEAMRGRLDEARGLVDRARGLYEALGQHALAHVNCGEVLGEIELLAGDAPAAANAFRQSCEALESIGDRAHLATRAAQLAHALDRTGELEEAARWARLAEESAAPDDIPTQILWRSARAKLLASEESAAEAVALASEARSLAERTDALNSHASVVLDLARVLDSTGHHDAALVAAGESLELFERKGNTVAAAAARALLEG